MAGARRHGGGSWFRFRTSQCHEKNHDQQMCIHTSKFRSVSFGGLDLQDEVICLSHQAFEIDSEVTVVESHNFES